MTDEQTSWDLSLILPGITNERDGYVERLTTLLEAKGFSRAHLTEEADTTRLCVHFDTKSLTVAEARRIVRVAGARLDRRYRHENVRIDGMDCPRCAEVIEHVLIRLDGVLNADVSYVAERVRLEYDTKTVSRGVIEDQLRPFGYTLADEKENLSWWAEYRELLLSLSAGVCLVSGWVVGLAGASPLETLPLYLGAYALGGFYTFRDALQNLSQGRLAIDSLMLAAALGAATLGEFAEGALLLFLFSLGHALEQRAMDRARRAIESLRELAPPTALVQRDDSAVELPVEEILRGDQIIVKPGQRIPADGEVRKGTSAVDQSPVTGESKAVDKSEGDSVFAGTVNGQSVLLVEVTRLARESTLARMMELVLDAETQRSPTQRFTDRFERIFVPAVLIGTTLLVAVPLSAGAPFSETFYRAIAVLVAASPCALAIGTPVAVLSAVARAARAGVLIKGGTHLENLGRLAAMAFDKTGTITRGEPTVTNIVSENPYKLLVIAAAVESLSAHPIARAITLAAEARGLSWPVARGLDSITGKGVRAVVDGDEVEIGNVKLFGEDNIPPELLQQVSELEEEGKTTMLVRSSGAFLGAVAVADTPREHVEDVLEKLHDLGVHDTIMLTGDNTGVALAIAKQVGLDDVRADLMPEEKVSAVDALLRQYGAVAMVGDGINDTPAMARSTVGIAMGGARTDVALETADVVLMSDDLGKLPFVVGLSRASRRIIRQNLWASLGMVVVLIPATLFGVAGIGLAVAAHEGSTLLVVLNALRLLRYQDTATTSN